MDYPKIRPVDAFPVEMDGQKMICLRDPQNFASETLFLSLPAFYLVSLFDGQHSIPDIQAEYMRRFGELFYREKIREVMEELDRCLFLDSETFKDFHQKLAEEFQQGKVRTAAHAGGCYALDPQELSSQLQGFFTCAEGPGLPDSLRGRTRPIVKGGIAPHIDLRSGGPCFSWFYKEIAEAEAADLFVILGTAHGFTKNLFALTAKDFETPLGLLETDRECLEELRKRCSYDFMEDEFAHRTEHTIEFQLLFLQYLYQGQRSPKILPILCGSFHEMTLTDTEPTRVTQFQDFAQALREVLAGRKACLIASADLAHVGLRYGDPSPVSQTSLKQVAREDLEMLGYAEKMDLAGLFHSIQKDGDRRRICGFPPIYTLLSVIEANQGKLLKYDQWTDPSGQSAVSFASLCFYD